MSNPIPYQKLPTLIISVALLFLCSSTFAQSTEVKRQNTQKLYKAKAKVISAKKKQLSLKKKLKTADRVLKDRIRELNKVKRDLAAEQKRARLRLDRLKKKLALALAKRISADDTELNVVF